MVVDMQKIYDILARFIHMFFIWIGGNYILFEPLNYWKTVIGAVIFSCVYTLIWFVALNKYGKK